MAAEYQIYSDVIDTYECSVCGYAYTETNTISNVHGDTAYLENELAGYINDLRESLGLNRLWHDNEFFNDFADLRAKELVTCFGHNRPNGEENTTTDGTYYVILENICGGGYDVYRIFQLFVHSNRHYRALIYEDAVGLAVGIYVREDGTPFTQVSIIASY